MITGFWYKVNGARQKKKNTSLAATGFTRCSARLSIRLLVSSYNNTGCMWALNLEISAGGCLVSY
jgi:hypothetical protein